MAKAWTFSARGLPTSVLGLTTDLPIPSLPPTPPISSGGPAKEEWILIETSHAALNPAGSGLVGLVPWFARGSKAAVPETDLSGTVLDVWSPETSNDAKPARFRKGDEVIAMVPFGYSVRSGQGALATHVALPASCAVPKPAACSFAQAAGVPVCGQTACLLVRAAGLKPGDRVLVNGASSGVGTFAVQVARDAVGSEGVVVGICSGKNEEFVKGLGVNEIVDYTAHKRLTDELAKRYGSAPFDAVLDCVGVPSIFNHSARFLKEQGTYASVGSKLPPTYGGFLHAVPSLWCASAWPRSKLLGGAGRTFKPVNVSEPVPEVMDKIAELITAGKVTPVVDSEWAFEDALEAYKVLAGGHAKGKVVIRVAGSSGSS